MSFQLFLGRFRGLCSTISTAPLTCCRRSSDRSPLPMGRLSRKGLAFSITKLGLSSPAVIGVWAAVFFTSRLLQLTVGPKHMGATFEKCSRPWRATINPDDVHSGDFLALSKIRGRWGGFKTLEKWVTGAFAGHTAVCLKDEFGNLWVGESGHENEKGEEIIVVIPWDEWWELSLKDESNPQSMAGKPYGYHNMIFSWIDTIADNYPPPLDAHLVIFVMSMWTRVQPAYAANMWNEALNKRLGAEDLDLYGILAETERQGITFDQLLTIPEQDDWVYSDGKSTTCVAFILAMYKEAVILGPYANSIQVTEFTVSI
ncbi:hypothetical protein TEA_028511 [Camellia sinensis var. sinensis]|uniref:Uncharacterized protein n=1 Tax=Camellia sinensis var. sinensis TaxID=542762 RepID=A0A4S4ES66_CAMSN|nr:hypothetical protein TEA_028511 [Camellia sinensis var. sinensis]